MKTKKLLLLFAFIATMFTAFSAGGTQANEIIITGSSSTPNGPLRAPAAPAINAYLSGDYITNNYLSDLGNVHIEVKDESESIVYKCTEPSEANNTSYIDLYSFESGLYTITITNDGSLYLQGVFEL